MNDQLELFPSGKETIRSPTKESGVKINREVIPPKSGLSASQLALARNLHEKSKQLKFKSPPPASEQ